MNYINKVIMLILIFVMLILSTLVFSYMSDELTSQRLLLNEVTQFIDKITDQKSISKADLDDFYLAINSYGKVMDAKVEWYQMHTTTGINGESETIYFLADDFKDVKDNIVKDISNPPGIIKVTIEEVTISPGRRLMYFVLGVDSGKYKLSLAAAIN